MSPLYLVTGFLLERFNWIVSVYSKWANHMVNISQTETYCAKFMYSFIKFTTSRRISLNYFPHVAQYFKTCFPFFVIIKLYKKGRSW